jgi:hypothetical protein
MNVGIESTTHGNAVALLRKLPERSEGISCSSLGPSGPQVGLLCQVFESDVMESAVGPVEASPIGRSPINCNQRRSHFTLFIKLRVSV